MRFIKRVGDRGTITVPSDVRDALGIGEGDIVELDILGVVKRAEASAGDGNGDANGRLAVPVRGRHEA